MPGIASISSELAGGDTSLAELDAQLDLFEPALAPSLDAVITSAALNPDSTLNEADQDDYPVAQADTMPSEESVGLLPGPGIAQASLPNLALAEDVSMAPAADITGSGSDEDGTWQVSADPAKVAAVDPIGVTVEAAVDSAPEAVNGETGSMTAPAAAMAMSLDSFDGAIGTSSLVYDGCWGEPVDGGERIYYDDGTIDGAYTRPYVIGDADDAFSDIYPLPVEGDDGSYVEGTDDWIDADEWDGWVYVEEGEDWVHVDEGENWIYPDDDWTYVDEGDEWLYEDEDWIYLDEWEDWGYVDEGDSTDIVSDPEVIVCWGDPDVIYRDAVDQSTSGDGDPVLDGFESAGETFTAAILPLGASDLFIA